MEKVRVFIYCETEKREEYTEKAMDIYGDLVELVESMEEQPDRVFMIHPVTSGKIGKEAAEKRIPVFYLTEDFIPLDIYNNLLRGK